MIDFSSSLSFCLSRMIPIGAVISGLALVSPAWALSLEKGDREARIATNRVAVVVKDGAFVEVRDVLSGKVWSENTIDDRYFPTGVGVLTDLDKFRAGHIPWGEPSMGQNLPPDFELVNYYRPVAESAYSVEEQGGTIRLRWKGLSNGKEFSAEASLEIVISETKEGVLAYTIEGFHPAGGVFAAIAPVLNLSRRAKVIVPSFGGMEYDAQGDAALIPFGGSPFMEAPLLIATEEGSALSIWTQDATMRSFYAFLKRSQKGLGFGMEIFNLIPYEQHRKISTPTLYLSTFDKGGWKAAATPFRNWYQEAFADEIAARDAVEWAKKTAAIIDIYMTVPSSAELEKLAAIFPKKNILFQIWNARAAQFDTELPDWTPRKGYVEGVKRIHDSGFKAMAYVNTYCANYLSPVWERDKLSDFVLTRKNGAWTYKSQSVSDPSSPLNEKLIGTVDYVTGDDQFANIKPGRLLYVDPLTPKWRTYHAEMMKVWNTTTGTDANYEDTAGTVSDSGNGVVEGLSAGEGSVAIMRLLQKTQPHVPMASEYGPAGIAFATTWALNYASHWGNHNFKRARINRQHPLTAYVYGYRQWISALGAWDATISHSVAATSDSTGGLGFILIDSFLGRTQEMLEKQYNWTGHFYRRTQLFSDKELTLLFPEGDYPEGVRCLYQGTDGVYSYLDDGTLQRMLSPSGASVYGRVHGANEVKTDLWLENWPLQNGAQIVGLNPEDHYPLFPKPADAVPCSVAMQEFPARVVLNRYEEGPGYVLMELKSMNRGPKEVDFALESGVPFSQAYINDAPAGTQAVKGALPLTAVFLRPEGASDAEPIRKNEKKALHGYDLYLQNGKNVRSHYVLNVSDKEAALEFAFANLQEKYPYHGFDGSVVRLLINGREIKSFDCLPKDAKTPDTQVRRWRVPVAEYAGRSILVSVETDCKANGAQDRQFISIPKIVPADAKALEEIVLGEGVK